jgi:hypothetical protein
MGNSYIAILKESLVKKSVVLDRVIAIDEELMKTLRENPSDLETFDRYLEEKEEAIQELNQLDDGFEAVYDKVAELLQTEKEAYASEIKELQSLTREVTGKTMTAQNAEARARQAVEEFFTKKKGEIRDGRKSSRVTAYYQMQGMGRGVPPSFMDETH